MVVPPALTYLIRDYLPQQGMIFPSEAEPDQLVLGPESVAWRTTSDVRLNLAVLYRGTKGDGRRYSALEPEAYAWVHATLLETFIRANASFCQPMSAAELDRFYREYRSLGRLIGVREQDLPANWPQFGAYFLGIDWSPLDEVQFRAMSTLCRAAGPIMPTSLKVVGPGHLRWRRDEMASGPLGRAA
jgi:uncharacterized protein (DUF2236 family)